MSADRAWPISARGRLLAYLAVGLVPWAVVLVGEYATLVFSFGLVDPAGPTLTDTFSYAFTHTRGLPGYLFAWPLAGGLYLLALGSVLVGWIFGREDRRVTAGLLVLVALSQLTFDWGMTARPGYTAIPIGAIAALAVVWVLEWPAIRGSVLPASR